MPHFTIPLVKTFDSLGASAESVSKSISPESNRSVKRANSWRTSVSVRYISRPSATTSVGYPVGICHSHCGSVTDAADHPVALGVVVQLAT